MALILPTQEKDDCTRRILKSDCPECGQFTLQNSYIPNHTLKLITHEKCSCQLVKRKGSPHLHTKINQAVHGIIKRENPGNHQWHILSIHN